MKQGRSALSALFLSVATLFGAPASAPGHESGERTEPEPLTTMITPPANNDDLAAAVKSAWDQARALGGADMPDPKTVCYGDVVDISKPPIIVLDPGHREVNVYGRVNQGGAINRGAGLVEVEIVDKVAGALRDQLEKAGYDVVMTREPGQTFPYAKGDLGESLSLRPFLAFYLGKETGRPVIFLSMHVDNTRSGGAVYLQNTSAVSAEADSKRFAKDLASSYQIGSRNTVIPKYRHNYRVLRNFEWLDKNCSFEGVSALLELGNVNDAQDIPHLKKMLTNPEITAQQIAKGITEFVRKNYGVPKAPQPDSVKVSGQTPSASLSG